MGDARPLSAPPASPPNILLVLDLRRPERRRLRGAAHARQLDEPLPQRVGGGRTGPVDREEAGVPGQDLREADTEQVHPHVPPRLEHVPRAPAHVAHHRPREVADALHRRRPQDRLRPPAGTTRSLLVINGSYLHQPGRSSSSTTRR